MLLGCACFHIAQQDSFHKVTTTHIAKPSQLFDYGNEGLDGQQGCSLCCNVSISLSSVSDHTVFRSFWKYFISKLSAFFLRSDIWATAVFIQKTRQRIRHNKRYLTLRWVRYNSRCCCSSIFYVQLGHYCCCQAIKRYFSYYSQYSINFFFNQGFAQQYFNHFPSVHQGFKHLFSFK